MVELKQRESLWRRLRRRLSASLSLKLIGIFVGGSVILAILIGSLAQFGMERRIFSTARPLLNHYIQYLEGELGVPPDIDRARELSESWPVVIRIFDSDREIRWASDARPQEPRQSKNAHRTGALPPHLRQGSRAYWDSGTILLKREAGSATVYYGFRVRPQGLPWFPLLFVGLILLGLIGFYFFTRRLFAPIKLIDEGVRTIGDGQLDHRIEMQRYDELGSLAERVNRMADQLQSMLQARRDLLLAISHELKSPLARSRVTLALLEDSDYRDALLRDQQEMLTLIEGIIQAERDQGDFATLHCRPCDIVSLARGVVEGFDLPGTIELVALKEPLEFDVDRVQIERLLRNLLENALRYNRIERGPVVLSVGVRQDELELCVQDHGPGIGAQHIDRLTEAFYRVDTSRERGTGGLGLGLYLCKAVLDAHGGRITINSDTKDGTRVECRIPREKERKALKIRGN